jgi:hypothetical protein
MVDTSKHVLCNMSKYLSFLLHLPEDGHLSDPTHAWHTGCIVHFHTFTCVCCFLYNILWSEFLESLWFLTFICQKLPLKQQLGTLSYVCVYVCVCVWRKEGGREEWRFGIWEWVCGQSFYQSWPTLIDFIRNTWRYYHKTFASHLVCTGFI